MWMIFGYYCLCAYTDTLLANQNAKFYFLYAIYVNLEEENVHHLMPKQQHNLKMLMPKPVIVSLLIFCLIP